MSCFFASIFRATLRCGGALAPIALFLACGGESSTAPQEMPDAGIAFPDASEPPPQTATITATAVATRFVTREHFLASGEMQISGEPFAQAMGRDLASYSRDLVPPDIYLDMSSKSLGWIDLTGFSTAIESYEYSKQPMNMVAFESGAGTALVHGPLVDPTGQGGPNAAANLVGLVQHFASGSFALGRFVFPAGTFPVNNASGDVNPAGFGMGAANPIGWPGIWPTLHLFKSFDPAIAPSSNINLGCAITSDDDPGGVGPVGCADYECDATTLHLVDRHKQIDPTITPGADGFSAWKYGLWALNYLQVMHDTTGAGVATVDAKNLAGVGKTGNEIVGDDGTGVKTGKGTYLGSSDIEGFQAQMFIAEIDNRAEDWLRHLTTTDGKHLGGFVNLKEALAYDYRSRLRWFPGEIAVTEVDDASGFPKPSYAIRSPNSELLDLIGLAMGYAEFYALTDRGNVDVGGAMPALTIFDGDPFPADDQLADGEPTLHDRALGMIRVALVNLDRLHTDPASGLLVDDVTMQGDAPRRGATVSTTSVAYSILGLRTVLRSLSSQLELYSNNTPDTAVSGTPLDALPIHRPSGATLSFTGRMGEILRAEGLLLRDHLTDATGRAWGGWDVSRSTTIDDDDQLDAHTAAVRGLFAAYLATGDTSYRDRAIVVYDRMERVFYDADARIYSATPAPVDAVEFTPLRFALLQSTLRDMIELVATRPGGQGRELELEERVGRLDKLVLNGWDDRNQNKIVDWPDECVRVEDGVPRGGLQMAERTLSGETGSFEDHPTLLARTVTSDREHDCVPEIDDAKLPSALASSITFQIRRKR